MTVNEDEAEHHEQGVEIKVVIVPIQAAFVLAEEQSHQDEGGEQRDLCHQQQNPEPAPRGFLVCQVLKAEFAHLEKKRIMKRINKGKTSTVEYASLWTQTLHHRG